MAFDAYHKWLGIPPAEQPPHHYRLLGIGLFESDADVIEGAADRQMAHVRAFQAGQHSALSQQILNELAAAKLCLLNRQKRAAYNVDLRQRMDPLHAAKPLGAPARPPSIASPRQSGGDVAENVAVADAACPDATLLSNFALGKIDALATERVSQHLAVCADCSQKVANATVDGSVDHMHSAGDAGAPRLNPGRTFVDHEAAGGVETTVDLPKSPQRLSGHNQSASVPTRPELANHPDYEIVKELGHGGMGVVYLARNRMMDRLEVLKVLNESLLERPGALERFQQEIRSAAKLSHINIVAAYAVLRTGDSLVFAMEYVRGQDLAHVVERRGPLPIANAAYYAHQVALGLQHAHEKGMVHRDIKPNNLMLAVDGKKHIVKILDFGLAKATSEKDDETGLTKSGQILGTPAYLAPEQSRDAQRADIRADIYSLGCTLYFLLSGSRPFSAASLYDVLHAHQKRDAMPLDRVRPEVPGELAAVVSKMMAKAPADRYQTPIEVARALLPFFKSGQAAPTPAPAPREQIEASEVAEPPIVDDSAPVFPPGAWSAPQAPLPVSLPRALPVAVPLSRSEFDTSIDFETPLIETGHYLEPTSRPWLLYLATSLAAAALVLIIAMLARTPRGTIEDEPKEPNADVEVETTMLVPRNNDSLDRDEFTPLFNGNDLAGWKPHPDQQRIWRVEKGILVGSGDANNYLVTERGNFTNFHLRIEARVKDRSDSGVYIRANLGSNAWPSGYEAQINTWEKESMTGSLYAWGSVGSVDPPVRVMNSDVRPNEWFTLEVIANDNHIVVKVNGQTTASYVDAGRSFPMGRIALEKYRPQTVVEFRKIEIREPLSLAP